ncbi:MAG: GspH/FimT family pseudopilin [Planctomycetota bacterium]|nr:GspH/FimT family pseudopilin [Planctomycetota bacterium]
MAAFRSKARSGAGGFTIVEFVGVLVLMTAVSTIAIRAWFGRSEVTLQNAAELLANDLRQMQTHATLRRSPLEVVFDADGCGYHARDLGRAGGVDSVRRYTIDAVFEDVRIRSVQVQRGEKLVFDAIGRPASDASITLVHRGVARTVLVDAQALFIAVENSHRGG